MSRWMPVSLLAVVLAPAYAQDWPRRPVRMVVPFTAGGGNDISARIIAQPLRDVSVGAKLLSFPPAREWQTPRLACNRVAREPHRLSRVRILRATPRCNLNLIGGILNSPPRGLLMVEAMSAEDLDAGSACARLGSPARAGWRA